MNTTRAGPSRRPSGRYTTLIEPSELACDLDDPDWVVLDTRFDLARPAWGAEAYAAAHIPHSLYAHLDHDLSSPITERTGRHPLPAKETLVWRFSGWGIDANVQVVAYDQGSGAFAARLWWLLRSLGHEQVAVLNGGFAAWQEAGFPVSQGQDARDPRAFGVQASTFRVASSADIERWLSGGNLERGEPLLVDARAPDRFAGRNETLDPVAGHIPGARNHPFAANLDERGRFLAPDTLRERWLELLQHRGAQQLVAMCGSGVTACHNLLALEAAGLPGGQLYAGSWSEWIRDPQRPVAKG